MTIYVQNNDIHLRQGDSGNICISGLVTDNNYSVYFAVSEPETNKIVAEELVVKSEFRDIVYLPISAAFTDKLIVPEGESRAVYQYSIKICIGKDERTVSPGVDLSGNMPKFNKAHKLHVYTKLAEGGK